MKVTIRDAALIKELRPLEVAAYLRATGWEQQTTEKGQWSIWTKGDDHELLLPLQQEFGDFALRMSEVLQLLQQVEGRSQQTIFNDLLTTGSDIVRVRFAGARLTDGSMPIDEYAKVCQHAREMMLVSACSALQTRAVWPNRRPTQATEYLQGVLIGQSERGSYVLTIHSRVSPSLQPGQRTLEIEEPFPRQVVERLALSLNALQQATEQAAMNGDTMKPFHEAVNHGVNANLCDVVAGLVGGDHGDPTRRVDVSFSWSRSRPIVGEKPALISFRQEHIPLVTEAARLFRATSPVEDTELRGSVIKLERQDNQKEGKVTVLGFIDDQPRKIWFMLNDPDYQIAIEAHRQGQPISCSGTLVRTGKPFELRDVRNIRMDSD
ncbi:MAG: hypothetical protein HQL58_04065 [Magnetococcales bacterium]|nr:hypothetical protein [Magnetococcales bacterium]